MSLIGCRVQIPCVTLYRDYEGNGPGKTISGGIYKCNNYKPDNIAPIHIENLVWVKCYPTGMIKTSYPPIYMCDSNESYSII